MTKRHSKCASKTGRRSVTRSRRCTYIGEYDEQYPVRIMAGSGMSAARRLEARTPVTEPGGLSTAEAMVGRAAGAAAGAFVRNAALDMAAEHLGLEFFLLWEAKLCVCTHVCWLRFPKPVWVGDLLCVLESILRLEISSKTPQKRRWRRCFESV